MAGLAIAACLGLAAHAQISAPLTDIGLTAPLPGPDDAYQLTYGTGSPDGLNYYFDNGSPPGQTFTTGSGGAGYVLTSLAIQTAGNSGQLPAAGQVYLLRIYSVSGTNATLIASYVSENNFVFTDVDWLQWANLAVALPANSQFAYSFGRNASGAGWENMANVSGNLYTGGEVALIPPTGGGMTLGSSHGYDATFVAGLTPATSLAVNTPTLAPSSAVTRGTAVTLTALAVGPGPLSYQWQTDGGGGGALTNLPAASGASLAVDTAGLTPGAYKYDVVVTNSVGKVTSAMVTLAITYEAGATLTDLGDTVTSGPNDISQFVGGGNGDGLNYYDDNGANHDSWTGQIFTTGTNAQGYYLTSVAIQTGGGGSSGTTTAQPYHLFIFSIEGANATLMAHYTNASFSFNFGDWLQWGGFSLILKSKATYAYAFGRAATGTGWAALNTTPNTSDLYAGGQICVIPAAGGTVTFGQSGMSDGVFDLGLLPIGVGPSPLPFANPITASPSRTVVVGSQVTLNEAATGAAPLHYIWKTDGGTGTLTNIPASDRTNLVVDTTGMRPGAYQYAVIVTNDFGSATSAAATLTVLYANATATLTDVGASIAAPAANDVSQLVAATGASSPDGLNYYFDNANPPGQTFTTGGNAGGYTLSSLAIKLAGNSGGLPAEGQAYVLRIYTVSGGNAVLYASYTSQAGFTFNATDWLRWSGFAVPLAPNSTYAYTLSRASGGSGWDNLSNVTGDLFTAGEVVLVPVNGGALITGSSHAFDATFVAGFALPGYPVVGPAMLSPSNVVYAGTPVSLSASVSGVGPFTYQWRTDGGSGGALTNIPGANSTNLTISTTGLDNLTVAYALSVANSSRATVGEAASLTVLPASLPVLMVDTTPAAATRLVGGAVTFAASFVGTLPIHYNWQVNKGAGAVDIPGQTNATLVLTNLTLADGAGYSLFASNSLGTASSTTAPLTVSPLPARPFTINYQWHSTEGGNNVGNYTGTGIAGYGSGTYWNQVIGPAAWTPGTYTSASGYTDDTSTDTGVTWTLVTGGSWDWSSTPVIPLLDSSASAYGTQSFTFSNLLSGIYNLVLFSCNGTESLTANAAALFTVNSMTQVAAPTQDTSFVEGNNYVVFKYVVVTGSTLTGTWGPTNGKSYGSLNGAQLQFVGPAITLSVQPVSATQIQLQWSQGTLLEADSLTGPWTTNLSSSPLSLTPSAAKKFYRVKVQ